MKNLFFVLLIGLMACAHQRVVIQPTEETMTEQLVKTVGQITVEAQLGFCDASGTDCSHVAMIEEMKKAHLEDVSDRSPKHSSRSCEFCQQTNYLLKLHQARNHDH